MFCTIEDTFILSIIDVKQNNVLCTVSLQRDSHLSVSMPYLGSRFNTLLVLVVALLQKTGIQIFIVS